ncbi:MAG: GntR family transcriptional regulator, partial [Candidatus Promineofilum sp.]|nr:GntR family transcriptional regulator [Promineifilum sp.]
MLNGKEPNSRLIYNRLIKEMRNGRYSRLDKLPPEDVLAEEMQISRTQLRDSLSRLESRGYISRRRGLG